MLPDFQWQHLLGYIQDSKVIPILGPDLLRVTHEGREILLDRLIAEKFCEVQRINIDQVATDAGLAAVVRHYRHQSTDAAVQRENFRWSTRTINTIAAQIIRDIEPPPALKQLAEIVDFKFFVSTTTDSLFAKALKQATVRSSHSISTVSYAPRKELSSKLPTADSNNHTVLFQLFGSISQIATDYVVTDEEMLEFAYSLHSAGGWVQQLLNRIRDNNLLLIGCNFPDWLTRFFLRNLSREALGAPRNRGELIVPEPLDRNLVIFLKDSSVQLVSANGAADFVAELYKRWSVLPRKETVPSPASGNQSNNSVFLSFATEDREKVIKIRNLLTENNIQALMEDLQPGCPLSAKLRDQIEQCRVFLPFISSTTINIPDAWFRYEWTVAIERSKYYSQSCRYLQPVVLDNTPHDCAGIPKEFRSVLMHKCPDGEAGDDFVQSIRQTIADEQCGSQRVVNERSA
jgi:hypothetical protein